MKAHLCASRRSHRLPFQYSSVLAVTQLLEHQNREQAVRSGQAVGNFQPLADKRLTSKNTRIAKRRSVQAKL